MWIIRPDAMQALEQPMIKKVLPRYVKVVKDKLPANWQIAKRILVEFDKSLSNKQLWQLHDKLMQKLYEARAAIDKGKLKLEDLELPRFSLLDLKILLTKEMLKSCELCERKCRVNRLEGKKGECKVGNECLISSEHVHLGEEAHISPSHTIFFMGCNFHCQFCQNWMLSQWYEPGYPVTPNELAGRIEKRRIGGCRNANWVGGSPTPNLLPILETLKLCKVNTPSVWNTNTYMSGKTMKILGGVIDVYLTDFKWGNNQCSERLSKAPKYWETCTRNHLVAVNQAEVTIRHLLMPNHFECCTKPILRWIAKNIKDKCVLNLMDQYTPQFKAMEYIDINRRITKEEFDQAVGFANKLKLNFIT